MTERERERRRRMQAINARYGTRRECSGDPERWDARREAVGKMLTETHAWVPPPDAEKLSRLAVLDTGMQVYFIQSEAGGLIKVGVAVDVHARVALLQMGSPVTLCVLATQPGGRALESALHRHFGSYRRHGEWFEPGPELLAYIAGLKDAAADAAGA